jgi:hypothetical protein
MILIITSVMIRARATIVNEVEASLLLQEFRPSGDLCLDRRST